MYWECADCLAATVTVTEHSSTLYAYVAVDGTFVQGAVFVDYKDSEGMPHNIITVRDIDVNSYKTMLLSGIGHIPLAKVE